MYLTITQLVSLYLIVGVSISIPTVCMLWLGSGVFGKGEDNILYYWKEFIIVALFYPVVVTYITFKIIQVIRDCT